jgi:hypothetical protein
MKKDNMNSYKKKAELEESDVIVKMHQLAKEEVKEPAVEEVEVEEDHKELIKNQQKPLNKKPQLPNNDLKIFVF